MVEFLLACILFVLLIPFLPLVFGVLALLGRAAIFILLIGIFAVFALAGCATTPQGTSQFVGKSVAEVVATQGPYATTFARADGSRVFMWQRNVAESNDRYTWAISCNAVASATAASPDATLDTWVIQSVTFEGKAC